MCPGLPMLGAPMAERSRPRWNDRRIRIFTEYADTKRYLEQQLRTTVASTDDAQHRIATFPGGMNDASREE